MNVGAVLGGLVLPSLALLSLKVEIWLVSCLVSAPCPDEMRCLELQTHTGDEPHTNFSSYFSRQMGYYG